MTTVDPAILYTEYTYEELYALALEIATSIGLDVSTWQTGDSTRSQYQLEARALADREAITAGFIKSAFLSSSDGVWVRVVAEQTYGILIPVATRATGEITLTNALGGSYTFEPGDLTFSSSLNDKTYKNTTGGTLNPGPASELVVDFEADEAGSASSAGAGEIDAMVTVYSGVTCSNADACVGTDEQSAATTKQQCRDSNSALSPDGPPGVYAFVCRSETLTGVAGVTRVREYPDDDTGQVPVYVATSSGTVSSPNVALIQAAVLRWATPLCTTPTVASAAGVTVAVTYTVWVNASLNKTEDEIEEAIETSLSELFAATNIGGNIIPPATTGSLYSSAIVAAIRNTFPDDIFRVVLAAPGDTALDNDEIPILGTVTPTINVVSDG